MDTVLLTTQILCYGVGIVSASLNIASFVRALACQVAPHAPGGLRKTGGSLDLPDSDRSSYP